MSYQNTEFINPKPIFPQTIPDLTQLELESNYKNSCFFQQKRPTQIITNKVNQLKRPPSSHSNSLLPDVKVMRRDSIS